jgi:hypothetical protein
LPIFKQPAGAFTVVLSCSRTSNVPAESLVITPASLMASDNSDEKATYRNGKYKHRILQYSILIHRNYKSYLSKDNSGYFAMSLYLRLHTMM